MSDVPETNRVGEVYAEHRGFIEAVAARHASNPADVPDIVQNVALTLCTSLDQFQDRANLRTWLFTVTRNKARDYYRREGRFERTRSAYETLAVHPFQHPDDVVHQGERLSALRDAIGRMRPANQQVVRHLLSESGVKGNKAADSDGPTKEARYRARHELRVRIVNDRRLG
jgi:RNA polymerase sigma factor (sigma-70 family)